MKWTRGTVVPAASWQWRQTELESPPRSRYDPRPAATAETPPVELCMLWHPSQSATPPEWKARAGPAAATSSADTTNRIVWVLAIVTTLEGASRCNVCAPPP